MVIHLPELTYSDYLEAKGHSGTTIPSSSESDSAGPCYEYLKIIRFKGFRVDLFEEYVPQVEMIATCFINPSYIFFLYTHSTCIVLYFLSF